MQVYAFNVTIKRSDGSLYTYIRAWNGNTEESARRALLSELFECELHVIGVEKRQVYEVG